VNVGILGGGQLGRMLALAGRPLGVHFRFLDPGEATPVQGLGDFIRADYTDREALRRFSEGLDVVTFEFENVPAEAAEFLADRLPVRPSPRALACARDRLEERRGLSAVGIPTADYRPVASLDDLRSAAEQLGLPLVLKSRELGYDGKGQQLVRTGEEIESAWEAQRRVPSIAEGFVPFRRELSSVAIRTLGGGIHFYPLVQNTHEQGILVETIAPAPDLDPALTRQAQSQVRALMDSLAYVGVIAVEWFETDDGLLANEIAPRVHNSGHWTQDGAVTSQFENHIRAVLDLPIGSTELVGARTVMTNAIGSLPDPATILSDPNARLHLYDKEPRPGRKLGHVNRVSPRA